MSMVDARIYRQHAATSREIAFIDPGVADLGNLLRGLRPEVHAIVLSPAGNPVRQMADALDNRSELRAIHIIAHGAPGEIAFTDGRLSLATISAGACDLARIGAALNADGELLLWSCETGRGARGERFIDALSRSTGALVAASTGMVGAAAKGGSWDLDANFGAAITPAPLSTAGIREYLATFPTNTWSGSTSTAWGTAGNWSSGVPGTGDDVVIGTTTNSPILSSNAHIKSLTISGSDTLTLSGSSTTLTVTNGTTLSSSGGITGVGTVTGAITATAACTATITASGGTLDLSGNITNSGSLKLATGSGSTDRLKLDGADSATSMTFGGTSGTLELGASGTLTLTNALTINANTVQLDGSSSHLTDNAGISLSTGTITGLGTVTGAISVSGAAHITASGGTLEIASNISKTGPGSLTLTVGSGASDRLLLDGTSVANTLSFSGSTGTLELNTSGTLTLTAALSIGANTVQLDGSSSHLTDNAGISLSTGTITGLGTVTGAITASGAAHITANGGTLTIANGITDGGSALVLTVTGAGDRLVLDGTSAAHTVTFSSSGTLELAAGLTVGTALSVGTGTVQLDSGGSLTDGSGISLSTGTITGRGTVTGAITASGAAHITASGGTLEIASGITNSGTLALTVGSGASDRLKLDAASTATSLAFSGSTGTLELNSSGTLTLTNLLSVGTNTVQLDGASSSLTDNAGISVSTGTITGQGTITGAITLSGGTITQSGGTLNLTSVTGFGTVHGVTGAGTLTASGGTLDLTGTISGATLAIGTVANSHLTIDGTATTPNAITLNNSNQTLEIGAGHSLTVNADENYAAGTFQIDTGGTLTIGSTHTLTIGSGVTLTDNGGTINTSGGIVVNGTLIGTGTINGPLTGSGIVEASGGQLELVSAITDPTYEIDAGSRLQIDGAIASTGIQFIFLSTASGGLGLSNDSGLVAGNTDSISGLNVSGGGLRTNFIDIEGHTVTVTSVVHTGTTTATVTLSDNAVLNLTNIANGSSTWFADTATDGAGGTYVFLSDTVCFMPGTRILTPEGEVAVEMLKRGDLVTTADGASKPIRWVGRQTVSRLFADPLRVLPIRIAQGALGETMPSRDLLVSPDHALLVDGVLIQAGALVNGASIVRESSVPPRFTYYHVELADHSLILAENTPAETFIDNIDRIAFDNWDEHEALADSAEIQLAEMSYPRAKAYRQVPRATRDRLARRAAALSGLSEVA